MFASKKMDREKVPKTVRKAVMKAIHGLAEVAVRFFHPFQVRGNQFGSTDGKHQKPSGREVR